MHDFFKKNENWAMATVTHTLAVLFFLMVLAVRSLDQKRDIITNW